MSHQRVLVDQAGRQEAAGEGGAAMRGHPGGDAEIHNADTHTPTRMDMRWNPYAGCT
jgi:hypothetical protein